MDKLRARGLRRGEDLPRRRMEDAHASAEKRSHIRRLVFPTRVSALIHIRNKADRQHAPRSLSERERSHKSLSSHSASAHAHETMLAVRCTRIASQIAPDLVVSRFVVRIVASLVHCGALLVESLAVDLVVSRPVTCLVGPRPSASLSFSSNCVVPSLQHVWLNQ